MTADYPEAAELDDQDRAEVFDETNLDDDAEFATLEDMPDVHDFTSALGDGRDVEAVDAADLDTAALDDEDLEADEDVDDRLDDDLEDAEEDDEIDEDDPDADDGVTLLSLDEADLEGVADVDLVTDPDDEEAVRYESESLSDADVADLGYADAGKGKPEPRSDKPPAGHPDAVEDEADPHQEDLLDEGVEETFPASDPVSVKRIT